mgnify:CR=1 FL=1
MSDSKGISRRGLLGATATGAALTGAFGARLSLTGAGVAGATVLAATLAPRQESALRRRCQAASTSSRSTNAPRHRCHPGYAR